MITQAMQTAIRYPLSHPPQVPFAATRPGAFSRIVEAATSKADRERAEAPGGIAARASRLASRQSSPSAPSKRNPAPSIAWDTQLQSPLLSP